MLSNEVTPATLFPKIPKIQFVSEKTVCYCGKKLTVQKTRLKTVFSMTGPFIAHETLLHCTSCSMVFGSNSLLEMVPKWCNVGYDVLVYVGRAMFQLHRTIQEVSTELALRNIHISDSEISYLGYKFIHCLAACHEEASPQLRQSMENSGGYVLHLDATHDGNAPTLMTGIDSLSKFVLGNIMVPSENADYIIPFLEKLKKNFGTPQACVHDMGKGICKAVATTFPRTPDFICHFHFLRDIGKDFLEPAYSSLRLCLRKLKTSPALHALAREIKQQLSKDDFSSELLAKAFISGEFPENTELISLASVYSMTLWILQGKHSGDGYGFPFDRPLLAFAKRILEIEQNLPQLLEYCENSNQTGRKFIDKLDRIISKTVSDPLFKPRIKELDWRCKLFDSLRKAMRIAQPEGKKGLNDDGTIKVMSTICSAVTKFRYKIDNNAKYLADKLCCKMAKQIDKWGQKLFADPIEVETPQGQIIIYPQRTNNILEQFFRKIRRWHRRKTGNNSLRPMLQTMLADTPLIKNLANDEYMRILLDGKNNLEGLFAELNQKANTNNTDLPVGADCLLPGFRKVIMESTLPEKMAFLLSKNEILAKSNLVLA